MAKIELQPISKTDKAQALQAIESYRRQNPVKFEAKKAELFARYGLTDETIQETELPKIKAKKEE